MYVYFINSTSHFTSYIEQLGSGKLSADDKNESMEGYILYFRTDTMYYVLHTAVIVAEVSILEPVA